MNMTAFRNRLRSLPVRAHDVTYRGERYLLTIERVADGRITKLYAGELEGRDIVSGNFFTTVKNSLLRPCGMSPKKVVDFVLGLERCS
jgi:peptide-methionine (S)-S-oxide reductase